MVAYKAGATASGYFLVCVVQVFRSQCKIAYLKESVKIIQQALEGIPGGPYEILEIRCFDRESDPERGHFLTITRLEKIPIQIKWIQKLNFIIFYI